jgi:sugar/nucleoside kinase (ribokinase family)
VKRIVTIGEILVEIMAVERGQSLRAPGMLIGPYPSGAPAIFIDQAARLGQPAAIIGCVGDDDFGHLNIDRLRSDGADVSGIAIDPDLPTGTAFVTYAESGERHFVFNIRHSASGRIAPTPAAERLLAACDHLHVMGTSLFSPGLLAMTRLAVETVKARGGSISFDPNLRAELPHGSDVAATFDFVIDRCDLIMPSGPELFFLTGEAGERPAIAALLRRGVGAVVVKRGAGGASYHDPAAEHAVAALPVTEVDPTGAGDCFAATFVVCRLRGMAAADCLRYANASGARTVTVKGPMEGTATFAELDRLLAKGGAR